jgi:DNA-binding YbaB/EbfC family protein
MAKGSQYMRGGRGGGMGGMDMNKLMKQAQQMQEQLAAAQDKLGDIEVSSSAGGGMVKVTATADMKLTSLTIDPDAVDPEDVELLQDMVLAAVNGALEQAEAEAQQQMNDVSGLGALGGALGGAGGLGGLGGLGGASGMGIPGLF